MSNSEDFFQHYRTLGINSPCDWNKLKKTYRKLANIWHPDRHNDNDHSKLLAEEKIKEINQAYKILSDYYRSHKTLPPFSGSKPAAKAKRTTSAPKEEEPVNASPITSNDESFDANKTNETARKRKQPSLYRRVAVFSLIAFGAYSAWEMLDLSIPDIDHMQKIPEAPVVKTRQQQLVANPVDNMTNTSELSEKRYFTYGSKIGEVHAAQGTPTKTEGDVWYYGKSEIHFKHGKVRYWVASLENPLNTLSETDSNDSNHNKIFFTIGSTKKKVLGIQGEPDFMTENSWEYGISKVYFSNGRVVNWYSSPLDPLKARK